MLYVEGMKHAPSAFRANVPKLAENATDDELEAWLTTLPPCPGVPSTNEEVALADARAEADLAAGRVYAHEEVAAWLDTWGSPDFKSFHEWRE